MVSRSRTPDRLAEKFGLIIAEDSRGNKRPRYMVDDRPALDMLKDPTMPCGHWRIRRYEEPARLVPRHCV